MSTIANWRKSSYSASNQECVEVALAIDATAVRDMKDRELGQLKVSLAAWTALIDAMKRN
jgi:hypothetical protein